MLDKISDVSVIVGIGEVIAIVFIAYIYAKSKIPKETIAQQATLIDALEKRIKAMEDDNRDQLKKHIENEKAIADLQGQIKVYKELPLREISKSLKALEDLPSQFEKISNSSAEKIISSVTHVKSQHVDTQTVRNETVENKQ